jgi:hypothetical protein
VRVQLTPGRVVEYWEAGTARAAVFEARHADGTGLLLREPSGHAVRVGLEAVVAVWPERLSRDLDPERFREACARADALFEQRASRARQLWEACRARPRVSSWEAAAELFGSQAPEATLTALRLLTARAELFQRAGPFEGFRARTEQGRRARLARSLEKVLRARAERARVPASNLDDWCGWPFPERRGELRLLAQVERYFYGALLGRHMSQAPRVAKELLRHLGYAPEPLAARRLFLDAGLWSGTSPHAGISTTPLHRLFLHRPLPRDALLEAEVLLASVQNNILLPYWDQLPLEDRRHRADLTELLNVGFADRMGGATISFSLQRRSNHDWFYVHLPDPTRLILPGSPLDNTAYMNVADIPFARLGEREPMLPLAALTAFALSEHRFSYALSVGLRLDACGRVADYVVTPSIVNAMLDLEPARGFRAGEGHARTLVRLEASLLRSLADIKAYLARYLPLLKERIDPQSVMIPLNAPQHRLFEHLAGTLSCVLIALVNFSLALSMSLSLSPSMHNSCNSPAWCIADLLRKSNADVFTPAEVFYLSLSLFILPSENLHNAAGTAILQAVIPGAFTISLLIICHSWIERGNHTTYIHTHTYKKEAGQGMATRGD